MKKRVILISLMLIPMMLTLMIAGCIDLPPVEEIFVQKEYESTDLFVYDKRKNMSGETVIYIMDITDEARNLEYLVVPEEIDGLPVYRLEYGRGSKNIKKVYIPYAVKSIGASGFVNPSVKCLYVNAYPNLSSIGANSGDIYVPSIALNRYTKVLSIRYISGIDNVFEANLTYMYNYKFSANGGVYFVDDLDVGESITYIPPDPKREGYIFNGWYIDPECQTQFDVESYIRSEEDGIINLYAGWEVKEV